MRREQGTGSLLQVQYKDGDGKTHRTRTWYIQLYSDGKRIRESAKTEDRREAQRYLTKRLAEVGSGRKISSDVKRLKYEIVRDAWKAYPRERGGTIATPGLKHVDAFFADWNIADITERDIDRYIESRRKTGVVDATIRRDLRNLQAILNYAHDEPRFALPTVPSFKRRMPHDSAPRTGFTSAADFAKLAALLPEDCRIFATFQFRTGCRTSAGLKITWDMVSPNCDALELPAAITKNNEPLSLPLAGDGLTDVAEYLRKQTRKPGRQIFAVGKGGVTLGREAYRYQWNKACGKLGFGTWDKKSHRYSGLRAHDMRRSAIKNMMNSGIPRKVAMTISGHKTEAVFNRYHIAETSDLRRALEETGRQTKIKKTGRRKVVQGGARSVAGQ